MPVFSLNSRVHVWPGRAEVVAGLLAWAERLRAKHPELVRIGYFGSLTDGVRYGFGSDADVVAVVTHSDRGRWYERSLDFDYPDEVPVPVDFLVYTEDEFVRILARGDLFSRDMQNVVWL
jgi:hypothetical protein